MDVRTNIGLGDFAGHTGQKLFPLYLVVKRRAVLTPEERYELFNMAQRVDDMLDGTITH